MGSGPSFIGGWGAGGSTSDEDSPGPASAKEGPACAAFRSDAQSASQHGNCQVTFSLFGKSNLTITSVFWSYSNEQT